MSRILGIDYGTKRIGIAISDPTGSLTQPLPFLNAHPFKTLIDELRSMVREKEIAQIVIGIPRNMDGSYGDAADRAREFTLRLQEALLIPITTVDERMTTIQASRQLRAAGKKAHQQKQHIDSASAEIILQTYLDSQQLNS
ncbi:MAG: Holliday junction resolvase RuvX [Verrucomicrobiota bacterium]